MKICLACGADMTGLRDLKRRKFCSRHCMVTKRLQEPLTNKSTAYYRARKAVTKSECERCGVTERLHVHHKDKNPLNDSPQNLQVLCSKCHAKVHVKIQTTSTCIICGVKFVAKSHQKQAKICSAHCARAWGRVCALKRRDGSDDCAAMATQSSRK